MIADCHVFHTESLPRMRELLIHHATLMYLYRITPAYAGTTSALHGVSEYVQNHSRVCGNYQLLKAICKTSQESLPRMRELQGQQWLNKARDRITPAYAGTTKAYKDELNEEESLPRMRELLNSGINDVDNVRITPAYAGTT